MLADPRAEALVENFAGQWLYLRNLTSARPDPPSFPDFDDNLRQSLRRETELFFASIMHEDRSVIELLTADYTFLNERLARHYGIPGVYGDRFRRVPVTDDRRRGLLGQGSILTVTSYATRTSPVLRGKWILDNLLGSPPPPPPPNVPGARGTPNTEGRRCASGWCSTARTRPARSATPRWIRSGSGSRTSTRSDAGARRKVDGKPIDASDDAAGRLVVQRPAPSCAPRCCARPEEFVTTFTRKLLTYALGRGLEPRTCRSCGESCGRRPRDGLPFLVDHRRHRDQRAVPLEGRRQKRNR